MTYRVICDRGSWKPLLVLGIFGLVLGTLLFLFPETSLRVIVILFGVLALFIGIGLFIVAWAISRSGGMFFAVPLIFGICALLLGFVSFVNPELIAAFGAVVLAILLIIGGFSGAISGIFHPGSGIGRLLSATGGIILAVLGILILFTPLLSGIIIVRILGVFLMGTGVVLLTGSVIQAFRERSCPPEEEFGRIERIERW
jgi:uncharacterized membrane protein HdeD (DUF308 family)